MAETVIIGAGPAGLTAGWWLAGNGHQVAILEKESSVGGISKTINYRGYHFDVGGHRFLTANPEILQIWRGLLGENLLTRHRLSRIFYRGKFFNYPLDLANVLKNIGLAEAGLILLDYCWSRPGSRSLARDFETAVTQKFGRRLYEIFFKNYTEKIWGRSGREISADWSRERIGGLSIPVILANFFKIGRARKIKTLASVFNYPVLGPGMFFDKMAAEIQARGGMIMTGTPSGIIQHDGSRITRVAAGPGNSFREIDRVISTCPLSELIFALEPAAPPEVLAAAGRLAYRHLLVVNLICAEGNIFPDNWIYINSGAVRLGRIQNYKNWSPAMVADNRKTSLGLEYFCSENDNFWSRPDRDLIELGQSELRKIGFSVTVEDGFVRRQSQAYPVYSLDYLKEVTLIKKYLLNFKNLFLAGRNGRFQYDNMDMAMASGLAAARAVI